MGGLIWVGGGCWNLSELTLDMRLEEFAPGEVGPGVAQDRDRAIGSCKAKG